MNCTYCGEPNLVDTKFCAECGKPLSGDLPSYMYQEEPSLLDKLNEFTSEIKRVVTEKNYKEVLSDPANPVTNMVIVFAAWLILRFVGIIPFIILVRILAMLMSVPGAIVLLALTYVYSKHQNEINAKVEELKGVDYKKTLAEIITAIDKKSSKHDDEIEEMD